MGKSWQEFVRKENLRNTWQWDLKRESCSNGLYGPPGFGGSELDANIEG